MEILLFFVADMGINLTGVGRGGGGEVMYSK